MCTQFSFRRSYPQSFCRIRSLKGVCTPSTLSCFCNSLPEVSASGFQVEISRMASFLGIGAAAGLPLCDFFNCRWPSFLSRSFAEPPSEQLCSIPLTTVCCQQHPTPTSQSNSPMWKLVSTSTDQPAEGHEVAQQLSASIP